MNQSMINSMVSMHGLQQKLDIIANNMANMNTVGYKRREVSFQDVLTTLTNQPRGFQQDGRMSPLGITQGWGARVSQIQLNMSQGSLQQTGLDLDLALEGNAMFELSYRSTDNNGNPVNGAAWTRNGVFRLISQPGDTDNVYLATENGYLVRGDNDEPIRIPEGYKMVIDAQGGVKAVSHTNPYAQPINAGRLKLVQVLRPHLLENIGEHLFILPANVNNNNGEVLQPVNLQRDDTVAVRQGFLEQSNVVLSDEMTELLSVQRAYQLASRALTSGDTMLNLANNLRP